MNFIVFLNSQSGELEKILSGTKSMLLKEPGSSDASSRKVSPGDSLYFLKNTVDCDLRVKATVTRILLVTNQINEDLSHILKEMQTRLQLTEEQFNNWSAKGEVMCIEFGYVHKIEVIHVVPGKIMGQPGDGPHWTAFEELGQIT